MRTPPALRSAAVIAIAALCLHQLVYLLTFGSHSGPVLDGSGHGYLAVAAPLLAALAVGGIVATILAVAQRGRWIAPAQPRGWGSWAVLLLLIFAAQEAGEALVRTGSLGHLVTLAESSGAAAVLGAVVVGRLVALALCGLSAIDASIAVVPRRRSARARDLRPPRAHSPLHRPRLALGFGFSRRPPPAVSG